tara:strand:- start:182 stop:1387 length:1206 start_codon:yes stop_codon:yes gene_type:complete
MIGFGQYITSSNIIITPPSAPGLCDGTATLDTFPQILGFGHAFYWETNNPNTSNGQNVLGAPIVSGLCLGDSICLNFWTGHVGPGRQSWNVGCSVVTSNSNNCSDSTRPSGLHVTNVIQNRATINWDNMNSTTCIVDQYRIKYRPVGSNTWSQKTMGSPLGSCSWSAQNTSKLLLNLLPNTTYEYKMKVWYCGGSSSSWTALNIFTTLTDCPNVGNFSVTTPTTTKATFNWNLSNGPYNFMRIKARIDIPGASWFNIGGFGVFFPATTKDKNNLTPGESYRGQARTWCSPNGGAYRSQTWTPLLFWTQPTQRLQLGTAITNLDIFPNPSRDIFNISFTSEEVQDLKVKVVNVIGEEIIKEDLQQFVGEYVKSININNYVKGIYFLEIETNNGIINKKLILQ